ncbi:hypothetical protein GmHk_14G040804 [Glycine max]|nr:hypothetical protein GmHk_14G040804 [Glycine max]
MEVHHRGGSFVVRDYRHGGCCGATTEEIGGYMHNIMSQEINMNEDNGEEPVVFKNIDGSDAFNTSQVFVTHDDVLHWARSLAYDIGFVVVIMRLATNTGKRGMTSYVLIGYEKSGKYSSRKCGCSFKLRVKPVLGGERWMVKLICENHNHSLAKSFIEHPYVGQLIEDENIIIGDMTKSMVKSKNILFTLKEHNANNERRRCCT